MAVAVAGVAAAVAVAVAVTGVVGSGPVGSFQEGVAGW